MYSLTQNFNTLAELQAFVAAMGAVPNGKAPATGKGASTAAASPSPSPAAPSPAAPAAPKVVKYEDSGIAELLKTASGDGTKKAAAIALLTEFGAVADGKVSGKHLKPEQYTDFKVKLRAIIDAKVEESIE